MRILVVDNHDSFVFNLVQYLAQLGAEVEVWRSDDVRLSSSQAGSGFDGILISPGPGRPEDAGWCIDLVRSQAGRTPILGVCLGLQVIAVAEGAVVTPAPELRHGITSQIHHQGGGVLRHLPSPFIATRYHSLVVDRSTVPATFEVTAISESGLVMALRHRDLPVEGVQFHPESVLTEHGHLLLATWLADCGDPSALARSVGLAP